MLCFSSKISSRILYYISLSCFITTLLLAVTVFNFFLTLITLCLFEELNRYFIGDTSVGIYLIFFSQLHWGYDVCEKTIEIKCFSYYIIADVKIDYLARVMFIRLPLYKITPFLSTFHTIFFSKKSYVQPTMRSRKLYSTPLREEYPFKLFGSLLHKRFIYHLLFTYLLIYLFIYLIIYIDRGLWNLFYTWVTIQYYLIYFVAQIVSVWAIENSVSWLLCLWHLVHIYIIPL